MPSDNTIFGRCRGKECVLDDDWYLTHGYVTIEQHRENLKIALGQMPKRYGRNG